MEDTLNYQLVSFAYDEQAKVDGFSIELKDIEFRASHPDYTPETGDVPLQMTLELKDTLGNQVLTKPATVLRNTVVYKFHSHEDNFHSRFRINERSFDELIKPDVVLDYSENQLKQGETINYRGYEVQFLRFNRIDDSSEFIEDKDIAVEGVLSIKNAEGVEKTLSPKFIIRNNKVIPLRDIWWQESLYARLSKIDPTTGEATMELAKDALEKPTIVLEVANNVPRQDILAIQAIEFPGINFVWLGCILMMVGLGLGMFLRFNKA